jgi:hypothetical protein
MSCRTSIKGPLRTLVEELGGVEAASEALGVHRYTLYRWGTRRTEPSDEDRKRVNAIARRMKLTIPFPKEATT